MHSSCPARVIVTRPTRRARARVGSFAVDRIRGPEWARKVCLEVRWNRGVCGSLSLVEFSPNRWKQSSLKNCDSPTRVSWC